MRFNSKELADVSAQGGAKGMWEKVRQHTGRIAVRHLTTINSTSLNEHYAAISRNLNYTAPFAKTTCSQNLAWPTEQSVFLALDRLKPTATGADGLPVWFLRQCAPVIAKPLSHILLLSINESVVPTQWKTVHITPIAKVAQAVKCTDYRPISITPILSTLVEKLVIRQFLYPSILRKDISDSLSDQFAFRPTGSTTAALIAILASLSELSSSNSFVHLIALDFNKAFDTVRHAALA